MNHFATETGAAMPVNVKTCLWCGDKGTPDGCQQCARRKAPYHDEDMQIETGDFPGFLLFRVEWGDGRADRDLGKYYRRIVDAVECIGMELGQLYLNRKEAGLALGDAFIARCEVEMLERLEESE